MPLAPHYTWSETDASLEVTVDVPGVSSAKADVFATDAFLKVNCPPYLFALDLLKEVDDSRSSATILPGKVVFKLLKREPGVWSCLAASGDKAELTRRRNASIDRAYQHLEEARRARAARKQQEDKDATQRSMEVDRRKRHEMDRRKAEELAAERARLDEWQKGLGPKEGGGAEGADGESDYEEEEEEEEGTRAAPDHPDYYGRGWRPPTDTNTTPSAAIAATDDTTTRRAAGAALRTTSTSRGRLRRKGGDDGSSGDGDGDDDGRNGEAGKEEEEEDEETAASGSVSPAPRSGRGQQLRAWPETFKPLPPPRPRLEPVQVSFTRLETGHLPAREQREEEIRAFRKQTRAAAAADPDAVDLAERQPLFLKDKGDELFRTGNYSGALNAYSRAIQLDDSHPAVRANRAACRLALGEVVGCVEDCDRALEMLSERRGRLDLDLLEAAEAAALRRQLVRLLVRRAQARVTLAGRVGPAAAAAAASAAASSNNSSGAAGDHLAAALRDYEEAMRLSPGEPTLESDYQELAAALRPADAAALRQRGDARFRSGDFEGAAEAFGAVLGLPRSRVAEPERLAAFSNRAACNLVLERYGAAVADCDAGLALLLPPQLSTSGSGGGGGGGAAAADFGAAAGEVGLARLTAWAGSLVITEDGGAAAAATTAAGGAGLAPAAAAGAAVRLLTRRGAAAAHLHHFAAAAHDYLLAADLLMRLGDVAKAAEADADAERMRALAEGREGLPPRPQPPPPQAPDKQAHAHDERPETAAGGDGAGTSTVPGAPATRGSTAATAADTAAKAPVGLGGARSDAAAEECEPSGASGVADGGGNDASLAGPKGNESSNHRDTKRSCSSCSGVAGGVGGDVGGVTRGPDPAGAAPPALLNGVAEYSTAAIEPPQGASLLDDVDD